MQAVPTSVEARDRPDAALAAPVVVLTSLHSTYGAQVLRSALRAKMNVVAVIVQATRSRGSWKRIYRYLRRGRLLSVVVRACEVTVHALDDRLHGRKRLEQVEEAVAASGVTVERVSSLNDENAHAVIRRHKPAIGLIGGTGILSAGTLELFPQGVINAHQGILPQYRGNYCNRSALLSGDPTGVSAYLLDPGLDSGPVLESRVAPRQRGESLLAFERRLTALGARFAVEVACKYLRQQAVPTPQPPGPSKSYHILSAWQTLRLYCLLRRQDRLNAASSGESTRALPADCFEKVACVLCGGTDSDVQTRGTGHANVVRCRTDGLLFLNPRPRLNVIVAHRSEFVRNDNIEWFTTFRRAALEREARAVQTLKAGGALLDIGCAAGTFFEFFPRDCWRLYGVDTSRTGVEIAREGYGAEVACGTIRDARYPAKSFDVVSVLDTLYYAPNPLEELNEIARVLKDDGLLVVEIPGHNYRAMREKGPVCWLLDGVWRRNLADHSHLYFFSPDTLRLLLRKAGFRVIRMCPEPASLSRGAISAVVNAGHFAVARLLFCATAGRVSIAGKELYLAVKAD
jgi:SAM-dependent methyltransferase/folate-dependent phosphoribosylglycinamide formyltransferase PurN